MYKKRILIFLVFIGTTLGLSAQIFVGWNMGDALGRSVDIYTLIYPKNTDWIAFRFSGGYTIPGPFFFTKKSDCISNVQNTGGHFRFGASNFLTESHHQSALFWGLELIVSKYREKGIKDFCDSGMPSEEIEIDGIAFGGAIHAGYTFNLDKNTMHKRFFFDAAIQLGVPLYAPDGFLASWNYIPGLGYGFPGDKGLNITLIAAIRYELKHLKFGYGKGKTIKR